MKRALTLFALIAIVGLSSGAAAAEVAAAKTAPAPVTLSTPPPATPSPTLAVDPYLGGELQSRVPMARFCRDWGQCELQPNGDPCDTPVGCVCGWGGGQRRCGRW